ncbi:BPG_G0000050.mRNA.1.CDS.1 [Saccharomyces cerevisiae]|nr:BPG_G0000050.mRNA.1.CDS.1 [Saccharomyces cerevisiae]CAI7032986.1 BPG_G0000050.mRNA.1.CDS.1 [Saccharomyces cerevisiae]
MNTKSLHFYEPFEIDGQRYIKMTEKEDLGVYEPGLTQDAFTAKDKYDQKGIIENLEKYGLCVIPNFIELSKCDQILEELGPHFYRQRHMERFTIPKGNYSSNKGGPPLAHRLEGCCIRSSVL